MCGQRQSVQQVSDHVSWESSHTDKANIWQACLPNKQVMGTVKLLFTWLPVLCTTTGPNKTGGLHLVPSEMTTTTFVYNVCHVRLHCHADRSHIETSHLSGLLETLGMVLIPQ